MSCLIEHQDACLPITAIREVELNERKVVLAGVGPRILLINKASELLLDRLRVFDRNAVHGLHVLFSTSKNSAECYARILVWGGQSIRIIQLSLSQQKLEEDVSLSVIGPEFSCPDWILDVDACASPISLGATSRVGLITAHNVLLCMELQHESAENTSIHLSEIGSNLKPMLFSADLHWISPNRILVAAGTVFGEIIVWSCRLNENADVPPFSKPSIYIHHFFTGHEGSIFGVDISPEIQALSETDTRRYLASCSDDRTIRIWDISSCFLTGYENPALSMDRNIRDTGFKTYLGELELNQDACLAKIWGHEARIWGAYFLGISVSEGRLLASIISRSEDATCQLWNLTIPLDSIREGRSNTGDSPRLSHIRTFSYHAGKHVWSLSVGLNPAPFTIYSGGADGNLFSFLVGDPENPVVGEHKRIFTGNDITRGLASAQDDYVSPQPTGGSKKAKSGQMISRYTFVADDSFLAMTPEGEVLFGRIVNPQRDRDAGDEGSVSWESVTTIDGLSTHCITTGSPQHGLGIIGDKRGYIWLYDHKGRTVQKVAEVDKRMTGAFILDSEVDPGDPSCSKVLSLAVSYFGSPKLALLRLKLSEFPAVIARDWISLPPDFIVTSAALISTTSQLVLGSRGSTIAVYDTDTPAESHIINPLCCLEGVHGEDTVTSISHLKGPNASDSSKNYILTTGRDGSYCVHSLCTPGYGSSTSRFRTVHQSSPALRLSLESASFESSTNDLILIGFRGISFVVWNETSQAELMSVECGGAHRSWAYHSGEKGRLLVWTKASKLHTFSGVASSHRKLRDGGHGREIKSMAISAPIVPTADRKLAVLATGGEDTLIRLFLLEEGRTPQSWSWSRFKSIRTLKVHTTGLQHIQWSRNARFLFSSAGLEEFQVWRVENIPGFGLGVAAEGEYPPILEDSDLRITHFEAVEVDVEDSSADAFLIFMSYSNSAIRVFYYQSDSQGCSYTVLAQARYTSNCLTHIRFLPFETGPFLITTATDGRVATWDLAKTLHPCFAVSNHAVKRILSSDLPTSPVSFVWHHQHSIHQSSIKAMTYVPLSKDNCLLITGGDDNALAVSILSSSKPHTTISTSPVPEAHVSAINDVTILQTGLCKEEINGAIIRLEFILVSSGNDQRIKIWAISLDPSKDITNGEGVDISLREDAYSAVADLSSMDAYVPDSSSGEEEGKERVVLCGVGMDMWRINR